MKKNIFFATLFFQSLITTSAMAQNFIISKPVFYGSGCDNSNTTSEVDASNKIAKINLYGFTLDVNEANKKINRKCQISFRVTTPVGYTVQPVVSKITTLLQLHEGSTATIKSGYRFSGNLDFTQVSTFSNTINTTLDYAFVTTISSPWKNCQRTTEVLTYNLEAMIQTNLEGNNSITLSNDGKPLEIKFLMKRC